MKKGDTVIYKRMAGGKVRQRRGTVIKVEGGHGQAAHGDGRSGDHPARADRQGRKVIGTGLSWLTTS